jgi:outer membrane protein assembly factor BamD
MKAPSMKLKPRTLFGLTCLASLWGFSMAACSSFETNLQDTEVSYLATARQNFEAGEEAMEAGAQDEAIKFFEHVKNKYPYSKYAALADLRIADAHFEKERWLEAADAYRFFVRFHPRHAKVPYAQFRIAHAYHQAIPSDFFIFPKAHEKDQSATRDAIAALDDYLARFPDDENVDQAKELRLDARTQLARHDVHVAEFYVERKRWRGAMWRYEKVATEFSETKLAPNAMLNAAEIAADEMNDGEQARAFFEGLIKKWPDSDEAKEAARRLAGLPKTQLDPSAPSPTSKDGGKTPGKSVPGTDDDKSPTPK